MDKKYMKVIIMLIIIILSLTTVIIYKEIIQAKRNTQEILGKNQENVKNAEVLENKQEDNNKDNNEIERKFEEKVTVPLSNAKAPIGSTVFNKFSIAEDDKFEIIEDWQQDEVTRLKYKKITSYEEYLQIKEKLSEIREMTKEDFINYFMIIVVDIDKEYIPKFERRTSSDNNKTIIFNFYKEKQEDNNVIYNGSWIVAPNIDDQKEIEYIYLDSKPNYEQF